jgi:predicted dehydrogenase
MVNVAVIGCGYWGPNLIRNFCEVSEAKVVACSDSRELRLNYIKQRFPFIKTYQNYIDILNDKAIDAVSIATPVSTHFKIAKEALLAGKHVLVEKPITTKSKDAEELIEIAKSKKKTLMVGHTFEYSGAIHKIKEIVDSKEIGDIYYFDSNRVNLGLFQKDINVAWDLAPHDISMMLYVMGLKPLQVRASGGAYINKGIEDVLYIFLNFPKGIIAHIHVSWLAPVKYRRTVIAGSKKMVVYDDVENIEKVKVFDRGVVVTDAGSEKGIFDRQLFYRTGDVMSPKIDTTESLNVECNHFIDCIRNNKKPRSDGESGLWVVKILEAAEESLKNNGSPVKIN